MEKQDLKYNLEEYYKQIEKMEATAEKISMEEFSSEEAEAQEVLTVKEEKNGQDRL